jgi:hypothetical protein
VISFTEKFTSLWSGGARRPGITLQPIPANEPSPAVVEVLKSTYAPERQAA